MAVVQTKRNFVDRIVQLHLFDCESWKAFFFCLNPKMTTWMKKRIDKIKHNWTNLTTFGKINKAITNDAITVPNLKPSTPLPSTSVLSTTSTASSTCSSSSSLPPPIALANNNVLMPVKEISTNNLNTRVAVHQQRLHDKNDRNANRDYLNFCDRVYTEQNNCGWRCAQNDRNNKQSHKCLLNKNRLGKKSHQLNSSVRLNELKKSEFFCLMYDEIDPCVLFFLACFYFSCLCHYDWN